MKNRKTGTAQKVTAGVLFVVSVAVFALSVALLVFFDAEGVYRMNKSEMLSQGYGKVCDNYSVVALSDYQDDFAAEELADTNFRYRIFKVGKNGNPEGKSLTSNFQSGADTAHLHTYRADIHGQTEFRCGDDVTDYFGIYDATTVIDASYAPEEYIYNRNRQSLYIRSGNKLFLVPEEWILLNIANGGMQHYQLDNKRLNTRTGTWLEPDMDVQLYEQDPLCLTMQNITIVNDREFPALGEVSEHPLDRIQDGYLHVYEESYESAVSYVVESYVKLPLEGDSSYAGGDMFVQMRILVDWAYRLRYPVIAAVILSLLFGIAAFVYLMYAAGRHKGFDGVHAVLLDKCPPDLYLACVLALEMLLIMLLSAVGYHYGDAFTHVSYLLFLSCGGVIGILAALLFCMSFAVNLKLGKWWRKTLVFILCRKAWRGMKRAWAYFCTLLSGVRLFWKVWLVFGALAFAELVAMASMLWVDEEMLLIFFFFKGCLFVLVSIALQQMEKLKRGAQRIAGGELNYKINTDKMISDLKEHGECLNSIGLGIADAVNERLKSERFKTELITNVSHDIKTPLTSIINYVDLLQKEPMESEAAKNYIEVLQRQSARLKKLIEDLMEASKASTGNLTVFMEQCDTGVMLVQTVGEYEERLLEKELELVIQYPEEQIFIEADNRHLWRVFDNLMNNICKYAQPHTRAYINLERKDDLAVITLRNISHSQLNISSEELMERFVRGDSSRNTEGSGLGLSIARSLTELMNGSLELVIDGDLFKVILAFPVYGTDAAVPQAAAKAAEKPEEAEKKEGIAFMAVKAAGTQARRFGDGVRRRVRRFFKRLGRFFKGVKMAAASMDEPDEKND